MVGKPRNILDIKLTICVAVSGDPSRLKMAPVVGALLGLAAISFVLGVVALCAIRGRNNSRSQQRFMGANGNISDKGKCISDLDGYEVAEKTPDVIQCNNKGTYKKFLVVWLRFTSNRS